MNKLQDRHDALQDAMLVRAGARALNSPGLHPEAAAFVASGENLLKGLALSYGLPGHGGLSTPGAVLARGLSTGDFKQALASTLRAVTVQRLTEHAGHRQFCKAIELRDFKQTEFPSVDTDFALLEERDLAEFHCDIGLSTAAGLSAQIRSFGRNVAISRHVIINDDVELVSGIFANAGASASRLEAGLAYALLESNPTLGDAMPMFSAGLGNIEASALDETALGSAMSKLRTMLTPASAQANLPGAFLIVAPGLELVASKLVHQCNLELTVITSAWLPAGRWYLAADPAMAPAVGLLHVRGSKGGLVIGPRQNDPDDDGVAIGVRFDVGVVALGRVGMVKGGA